MHRFLASKGLLSYVLAALFLWIPGLTKLGAQETDTSQIEYLADPVVLTGTRSPQRLSQVPSQISIIDRDRLAVSYPQNVLELVAEEVPGVFLDQQNLVGYGVGPNSGGSLSIRGLSGTPNTQVLILVNGQPQFMGIFGHPIQDAFMATDIERIEVIQGPASVLYGTNALGGAINIITRQPTQKGLKGGASLVYGSFNTLQAHGYGSYVQEKFSISAALNHERTDGFREDGNNSFHNTTGFLKLRGKLSDHWNVSLEGNISDSEYFFPGARGSGMTFDNDRRDYLRSRMALTVSNRYDRTQGSIFFYRNDGDHDFNTGYSSTDFSEGLSAFQNFTIASGATRLTLGLDYQHVGGFAQNDRLPPPARVGFNTDNDTEEWSSLFFD